MIKPAALDQNADLPVSNPLFLSTSNFVVDVEDGRVAPHRGHFDRTRVDPPASSFSSPPPPPPHTMAQCVMSSVAGVRASVPVPRSTRVSQPRKLNGPRVVTARAITQTVAETPNANAALYDQFKALLVDYEFSYKIGDRVSGKVFHCDSKGAWVDIGAKAAALCPAEESSLADVRNVSSYLFDFRSPDFGDRWR